MRKFKLQNKLCGYKGNKGIVRRAVYAILFLSKMHQTRRAWKPQNIFMGKRMNEISLIAFFKDPRIKIQTRKIKHL